MGTAQGLSQEAGTSIRRQRMHFKPPRQHGVLPLRRACAVVWTLLAVGASGVGQTAAGPPTDAAGVVRRAVASRLAADAAHQSVRFVLHKQDERHNITQEIIETPQGDVALLVGVNGGPLSPAGRAAERTRLETLDANPEYQEHRHRREQDDATRVRNLLGLLPEAFVYHYDSTVACDVKTQPVVPVPGVAAPSSTGAAATAQCFHMTFSPKKNWDPPNLEARVLKGMAGEIWIESSNERLWRLKGHLIEDVDFGWGIVGRLDQGGTIDLEQTRVGDTDWELTRMKLNFTGRALMVKALSFRTNEEMGQIEAVPAGTDYHKAIKVLEAGQPGAP
jgi:hypothetical protein